MAWLTNLGGRGDMPWVTNLGSRGDMACVTNLGSRGDIWKGSQVLLGGGLIGAAVLV